MIGMIVSAVSWGGERRVAGVVSGRSADARHRHIRKLAVLLEEKEKEGFDLTAKEKGVISA